MLFLAACSNGEDFEVPPSESERLRADYGIGADATVDLPPGSRIVFFGDSITVGGVEKNGYVTLVREALATIYPDRGIEVFGSGVEGDKVTDLARRLSKDVLAEEPTHVVVYVGVNDVASLGPSRAALDAGARAYRSGLADLVDRIRAAGAEVMLCTPSVIGEDVDQGTVVNYGLELFATQVRQLAAEKSTGLCDLRSDFTRHLVSRTSSPRRSGVLTVDGIHLNAAGNRLVARTILQAFTGSEGPAPSPFVVPTVSPRPQPVRSSTPAGSRPAPPPPEVPSPSATPLSSTLGPSPTTSPSPEPAQTPSGVPTPESSFLESPSAEPEPPE
ncbi:MAG TPA: GDSL-type esterase/lipase family protein [Actinomycetota bacterium]|nr:GDSL-type esterase/lipase family protein [Actinomycetota bacterium]